MGDLVSVEVSDVDESDGLVSVEILVEVDVEVFSVYVDGISVDVDGISVEVTVLALVLVDLSPIVFPVPCTTPLGGNAQFIPVSNNNK